METVLFKAVLAIVALFVFLASTIIMVGDWHLGWLLTSLTSGLVTLFLYRSVALSLDIEFGRRK